MVQMKFDIDAALKEAEEHISTGFAPLWQPRDGDVIRGVITEIEEVESEDYEAKIIVVKDLDNKEYRVWANKLLMKMIGPEKVFWIGNEVVVKFLGKRKCINSSKLYNAYVAVKVPK